MKRLKFILPIAVVVLIIAYFNFRNPFNIQKLDDGWRLYENELITFQYPNRLRLKEIRDSGLILLTDKKYEILINPNDASGATYPEELVKKESGSFLYQLKQKTKTNFPSLDETQIDSLLSNDFLIIKTDVLANQNYLYHMRIGGDTIQLRFKHNEQHPHFDRLNDRFIRDHPMDNGSFRKIYFDYDYGQCYIDDLDNRVIFVIAKTKRNLLVLDKKRLSLDEMERILLSVRLK